LGFHQSAHSSNASAESHVAVIYSLLITARRYRLDPAAWLTDVLRRIPTCTHAHLPELLPSNWKPQLA